jgi:translation initiation factor 3 subunit J
VLESWDAADDSEEERKKQASKKAAEEKAAAEAAANKKTKSQRIAERQEQNAAAQREAAAQKAGGDFEDETPAERRIREEKMRIEGDMKHAEDLFAAVGIDAGGGVRERGVKPVTAVDPKDPAKSIDLSSLPLFTPANKDGFTQLREVLVPLLAANTKKAHYVLFLQEFVRQLSKDLPSEQVRKIASGLTILANEKQKEEKAAEKGGKKTKAAKGKIALGAAGKEGGKLDTTNYNEPSSYGSLYSTFKPFSSLTLFSIHCMLTTTSSDVFILRCVRILFL